MSSSANPATRQALAEIGVALTGAAAGNVDLNADFYYLSGVKALQRAGLYLAIMGPDGRQLFAGGSPNDGVRYFTGPTYLFRTNDFTPLAQFDVNGLTVNANITHTIDNAFTFGAPDRRAAIVYAATGTINTSDARDKTEVSPLTEAEIAAAMDLARRIGTFRFLQSVLDKGEDARLHIGMTVQQAMETMRARGLDPFAYAFICHDEWDAIAPTPAVEEINAEYDEEGAVIVPGQIGRAADPGREAGDRYGFRVDRLLLFIARGFDARLIALEAKLA